MRARVMRFQGYDVVSCGEDSIRGGFVARLPLVAEVGGLIFLVVADYGCVGL